MRRFVVRSAATQAPLLLLISVLVAFTCVGTGAASTGMRATADTMFTETLARAPQTSREINISFTGIRDARPAADEVGPELVELTGELQPLLGEPRMATLGPNLLIDAVNDRVPPGSVSLTPTAFSDVEALVEFTEGRAPGPTRRIELPPDVAAAYDFSADRAPVVEVSLLPEAAEELDLPVGTYVVPDSAEGGVVGLAEIPVMHVVGLYEPRDDAPSVLDDASFTRAPGIGFTNDELLLRGAALVAGPEIVPAAWPGRSTAQWTLPVEGAPAAGQADEIAAAVNRLSLTQWPFQEQDARGATNVSVVAGTTLGDTAEAFVARWKTSDALVLLPLSGLLVAGLVSVTLAARLLARRRSRDTRTVYARGASVWQLGLTRMLEALAVVLPGVALGLLVASRLAAGTATGALEASDVWGVGLTAAAGVTTMAVAGLLRGGDSRARTGRQAVSDATEAVVVVLAVGGVALLLTRGNLEQADPVLLLVPVLVASAATFLMLRLVRLGLQVTKRLSARTSGLVSLVGPTRAADVSRSSVLPTLAVVLAVSVGVLAVAVTDTVSRGIADSGWQTTGADVQVRGLGFGPDTVRAVEQLAGVEAVAPTRVIDGAQISDRTGRLANARLIAVDGDAVRAVTAGTPVDLAPPAGGGLLARASTGVVPRDGTVAVEYAGEQLTLDIAGEPRPLPGFEWAGTNSVLVGLEPLDAAMNAELRAPNTLLIAGSPDTDTLQAVVEEADPEAEIVTRAGEVAEQRDAPLTARTVDIFTLATAGAALLSLLGVLFAVAFGAPGRRRTGRTLRTLGASRRQSSLVAAVELLPTVLLASVVGGLCGGLVAWVAGSALDLRLLTGQPSRPAVWPDVASTLQVAGLTVVTATVVIAAALTAGAFRAADRMSYVVTEEES